MNPDAWLQGFSNPATFRRADDDETAPADAHDERDLSLRVYPPAADTSDDTSMRGTHPHQVWLSVWWPDAAADVEDATAALLPDTLHDDVFGVIPQNLRPAVAYAVLREQVASFSEARRCREAVGFELPGGQWAIALPVSVADVGACDLVAVFTIDTDPAGFPIRYRFSSWVTPSDAAQLIRATHRCAPHWAPGDDD